MTFLGCWAGLVGVTLTLKDVKSDLRNNDILLAGQLMRVRRRSDISVALNSSDSCEAIDEVSNQRSS